MKYLIELKNEAVISFQADNIQDAISRVVSIEFWKNIYPDVEDQTIDIIDWNGDIVATMVDIP